MFLFSFRLKLLKYLRQFLNQWQKIKKQAKNIVKLSELSAFLKKRGLDKFNFKNLSKKEKIAIIV